jgi:hypothetical protein
MTVQRTMNELETRRKAFQNVGSDEGVTGLWGIAQQVIEVEIAFKTHGPVVE